jgi:hypothetical protein
VRSVIAGSNEGKCRQGQVDLGSCLPRPPTDPDVLNSSIRFLKYTGSLRDTQSRTRGSKKPRSSGASLNRYAIRWSFVKTLSGPDVPVILPSNDSVYSALLSLHGVPRDGSPASSVQWIATTP